MRYFYSPITFIIIVIINYWVPLVVCFTLDTIATSPRRHYKGLEIGYKIIGDEEQTSSLQELNFKDGKNVGKTQKDQDAAEVRNLPFSMIIGQKEIKEALVLLASNPRIGGVLISGGHGTGKSVLAKAVHRVLPETIEKVKGSVYNIDPIGRYGIDSFLFEKLVDEGKKLEDLPVEEIRTPFVQIPLNVMEDSLVGTVDLEKSVVVGHNVFLPGLLAKAHRGLLYIDDINLLDENIVDILFDVMSEGYVKVEREGLSVKYPCVPLVVATFNEQEGEIRDHLKDRIAISLSTDASPLGVIDRVKAVDNFITFSGDVNQRKEAKSASILIHAEKEDNNLREKIKLARLSLDDVQITNEQILYLCEEATRAGCEGQRAEIFAVEVAKTNAAFHSRSKVKVEDLKLATILVIAPRSKFFAEEYISNDNENESSEGTPDQQPSETVPMSPTSPEQVPKREEEETEEDYEEQTGDNNKGGDDDDGDDEQEEEEKEEIEIPTEFMFEVTGVPLDPALLNFAHLTKKGKGGKSSRLFNLVRGHYVKPIFPLPGKKGRLAVGATLRAAAPYQRFRRSLAMGTRKEGKPVYIDKSDFRIKRMKRKAGALVIFVVDASGSMALNRMDAAKGAAIALLSQAYKARDKISLVVFRGEKAEVLVPPTKSIALTKARVESMPCGGGSPLAHALVTAARVGVNECKIKKDVGRIVIVIISDGRANIPLCISEGGKFDPISMPSTDGRPSKQFLLDEALSCAKQLGKLDCNTIVIDTEDKFVSTGIARDIAIASFGKYCCIDARDIAAIRAVTRSV